MRYGTCESWEQYFKIHEGITISDSTIKKMLTEKGAIGKTARSKFGRIINGNYFSEVDVRSACDRLLVNVPKADELGFFEMDGICYGTKEAWAREFHISTMAIDSRLKKEKIETINGRNNTGPVHEFYPEDKIRELVNDLLQLPLADNNGFIEIDGTQYGSTEALSQKLETTNKVIKSAVIFKRIQLIKGRQIKGVPVSFFPVDAVCQAYTEMNKLPIADDDGFFEMDGEKYGSIESWGRYLPISRQSVRRRLKRHKKAEIKGLVRGIVVDFYSESDIRSVCSDLLMEMPLADKNGFFELNGERYSTLQTWAETFGVTDCLVGKRIRQKKAKGIKGKLQNGLVYTFYSESDIRSACSYILKDLCQADEDGYFEKDGMRYGLVRTWAKMFNVSYNTVLIRLNKAGKSCISGKDNCGRVLDFFSEKDILESCSDISDDTPIVTSNGFLMICDKKYGTLRFWFEEFSIPASLLSTISESESVGKVAKLRKGNKIKIYSEEEFKAFCGHLPKELPKADETGVFIHDGERYSTIAGWGRLLPISQQTIDRRIKDNPQTYINGVDCSKKICKFYSESDVRNICSVYLEDMPVADENGFIEKDGIRYGLHKAWEGELGVSETIIKARIAKSNGRYKPIKGKKSNYNKILEFYSESDIRELCADHLENYPTADENGFIDQDGTRYGAIQAFARLLKLYAQPIALRVNKYGTRSIKGKDKGGRIQNFYSEPDVLSACADLLAKRKSEKSNPKDE